MQQVVESVLKYPMETVVSRYAREEDLPLAVAVEHERELKRFLALICLNPNISYGMKGPIDKLWHTFIVHTREYREFCHRAAGRFIDHVPEAPDNDEAKAKGRAQYERFLADYQAVFNEEPPRDLWPRFITRGEGASCSSCNGCGGPGPSCGANSINECSGCSQCSAPE